MQKLDKIIKKHQEPEPVIATTRFEGELHAWLTKEAARQGISFAKLVNIACKELREKVGE